MARVLVIDDDPSIREIVGFVLADEGHHVEAAADGEAALTLIARQHPDLIVLDMKLPGLDGWGFARRYREQYNHRAPILVLTAATDAGQRAAEIGADGFLEKPFDLETLIARVAALARG